MNKGIYLMVTLLSVLATATKSIFGYEGGHMSSSPSIPNRGRWPQIPPSRT